MSFADAVRERSAGDVYPTRCRFALLIESIDPDLADEILEAMEDRTLTLVAIAQEIEARGLQVGGQPVSVSTLTRHRRGLCRCP